MSIENLPMKELLDLKASQIIILHAINEESRTSREVVDHFMINYPEYYTNSPEGKEQGLLTDEQLFPMIRYLGRKDFIKRDTSQRWMITRKGRSALLQNTFLTFRNVMRIIADPYELPLLPPGMTDESCKANICLSIEPLRFPSFPSTVTKRRLQNLQPSTFYLIDLGLESYENKLKDLLYMNNHLNSLTTDVNTIIGEFTDKLVCLDPISKELTSEISDESVDFVFAQFVFVAKNPRLVLKEIFRVLKTGQYCNMMDYTSDKSLFHLYQNKLFTTNEVDIPSNYQKILNPEVPLKKEKIVSMIKEFKFKIIQEIDVPNLPRFLLQKSA
jgi:hypothetical protein